MRKQIPNVLTLSRFPAAALILCLYLSGYYWAVVPVFILAALTDAFDGHLARKWNCASSFGAKADPYADKALCWTGTVMLIDSFDGHLLIAAPLVFAIGAYDIGLGVLRFLYRRTKIATNTFAKRKTIWLMTGISVLYLDVLLMPYIGPILWWPGVIAAWGAAYFALRAAAEYVRAFGFIRIPSIPYIL